MHTYVCGKQHKRRSTNTSLCADEAPYGISVTNIIVSEN